MTKDVASNHKFIVRYRTQTVGNVEMFYREAGPANGPVLLLLHGFPTASHMFRDLIPLLAGRYRVIAPDLPGFGQTKAPERDTRPHSGLPWSKDRGMTQSQVFGP